jgi:hypothetical protein
MQENRVVKTDQEHYQTKLQEKNPPRAKYTKDERENEADPKVLKKANTVVTKPITRMGNIGGRPKKYTPTKMRNRINDYFCDCEKKDKVPSIKGMMLYLKMNPQSCYSYMKYPEYEAIFEQARLIISEWLESDVYVSKGQSAGKLAYMQNLHNWSNKTEVETTTKEMTVEEARAKIELLAPALLEMLKSSPELLRQLLPPQTADVIEAQVEKDNE